jgi:hypothetical protein
MTWGEVEDVARAGDFQAQDALRGFGAEMADAVGDAHSAYRHGINQLYALVEPVDDGSARLEGERARRERALLTMAAVSCAAAVVAAAAAILAILL